MEQITNNEKGHNIELDIKNLPKNPGVYLMHNKNDEIIYVGKAKNLKNRVTQYFRKNKSHTSKVIAMVSNVAYFEYIITDSELEALVLECNLIKAHRPKYNILLKDDKHYPFLKISMQDDYPKISIARKVGLDKAKYFGPYIGINTIKNTIEVIQKIFHPPTCKKKFPRDISKGRPCLNYYIKNCFAPCTGEVSQEEYKAVFSQICRFLEGNHTELINSLTDKMNEYSKNLEFEKAGMLRDKIRSIVIFEEKQKIFSTDKNSDSDILALAVGENISFVEVFFVRSGKLTGREAYEIDNTNELSKSEILNNFVKQFYLNSTRTPSEIILEENIEDIEILKTALSERKGKKILVTIPQKGEKAKFIEMVRKNAQTELENYLVKLAKQNNNYYLEELTHSLNLPQIPKRIEAYDISNISGDSNVGVMVVFENGKSANKKYRYFQIKTVEGSDDYSSTSEVIYRRLRRGIEETERINNGELLKDDAKFLPYPDLIFADGGIGHVHAIKEMIVALDLDIPVFGLVKDNKHKTRAIVSENGEIELSQISAVFKFVTRIQDEVHRVSINYFHKLHSKKGFHSELDDIEGVGKIRRNKLIECFGGLDNIKKASIDELKKIVDKKTADNIYKYFNR